MQKNISHNKERKGGGRNQRIETGPEMRVDKLTGEDLNMVIISILPIIKKNKECMNMMKT